METSTVTHPPENQEREAVHFFRKVRARTEELFEPLSTEDHLAQPKMDISPPKWHLAHTTWFFEEFVLKKFDENYQEFDENFGYLFNSYYNNVGKRVIRDQRGFMTRPPLEKIYNYRHYVTEKVRSLLNQNLNEKAQELVILGLNHEQQHQELFLTDFKYILAVQPFYPVYNVSFEEFDVEKGNGKKGDWKSFEEGIYEIGFEGTGFHFDNELGRHKTYLNDFKIANWLITNAEWMEFMEAGGYDNFNLWHADGWAWLQEHQISHPLYWENIDGKWHRFSLVGLVEINLDEPVSHLSFYEAFAFAEWKSCRLPTEAEWEVAADELNWGQRWEWTNSAYLPYPNFQKEPGAVGEYNGKFMVNQMVLRGASIATAEGHSRKTYRNFFQPELRWQFTGLRLAKS